MVLKDNMAITKEAKYKQILKSTRFYKNTLPQVNEYVYTYIKGYQDMGINCFINEYKADAFMSFRDASSSKKLRNIRKEVIKSRNYILMVTKVDNVKGFIDVEKRSIDTNDEKKYIDLINFYQKIFGVFIKTYVFNNIECTQEEVYAFLDKTLWRQNPKNIRDNLYLIHNSKEKVKDDYGLNTDIGNLIFEKLIKMIPTPVCKINIKLQINSLSIDASDDIKTVIKYFEEKTGHLFRVNSAPLYECIYNVPLDNPEEDLNKQVISDCDDLIKDVETRFKTWSNELNLENLYIKNSDSYFEIGQ